MTVEKLLERRLCRWVKKTGGLAIKFFCPTFTGLPDRILLLPGGKIEFVELKSTGKKQSPRQVFVADMLKRLGFNVTVIDSDELLNVYIERINTEIDLGI